MLLKSHIINKVTALNSYYDFHVNIKQLESYKIYLIYV